MLEYDSFMLAHHVSAYAGWKCGPSAKQREDIVESSSDRHEGLETSSTDAMQTDDSQLGPAQKDKLAACAFDLAQYSTLLSSIAALVAEADDVVTPSGACPCFTFCRLYDRYEVLLQIALMPADALQN